MKLRHFRLQRWVRVACVAAGLSIPSGWVVALAAPVQTFDYTECRPTPIYLGWGDAVPVPADYSGDGRAELAVYWESSGMWHVRTMATARVWELQLGGPGWNAYPADYDGDGKADPAVYGNGVWGAALSSKGYAVETLELGANGFVPVPADYDGDGKADPAVYGNGVWGAALSSQGYAVETLEFGASGFVPVPADYDNDGKADPAVYSRTLGLWGVALSSEGYAIHTHSFNCPDATPVTADFDGDGKTDLAIYHDASGLWLGCLSSSNYALSYQMLGGGEYVPVAERFYHTQRHTFGVYKPSTGEWLVSYPPAIVGDGEGLEGGLFGDIFEGLLGGIGGDVVCWGVGWLLDMLTHQNSGQQEIQQQLNAVDAQLNTLEEMTGEISTQISALATQLNIDMTELDSYIQGQNVEAAIDNITTHYDQGGSDSLGTFYSSTFTNDCPDTNEQQLLIGQFATNVIVNFGIKENVTAIHNALMPGGFGEAGLLWSWTTNFILSASTADSLFYYYLTLESYYAYIYSYMMKGAETYVEAEHLLYSNDFGYVLGTLTPSINAEVDQFQQCTYKMLLSKADFVNNFSPTATFAPIAAATNILFRNVFMAAQARGTNAYGLNAMILATMDTVTNGIMPPIVAFYDWMPPPTMSGQQAQDATWQPQPPVQYFYPVTSRWISVTSTTYDCWSNGRMHATNIYAFLQYGFGTNLPFGTYYWQFSPSQPWDPSQDYGGDIKTGHYDDSLKASSTGHVYGFFLTQLRNGGPSVFAGTGSWAHFSTTTETYQVLTGDAGKQGAIMSATGQHPAGTNIVVVSVLITNGPLDNKHFNSYQGDITVNAHALWSFTYDGQTPATGALQYKAWTSGSYMIYPGAKNCTPSVWQTDSFVAQIDVFDKTTNGVCAKGVVKSYSVNNHMYDEKTTVNFGTNTQGAIAVQLQPGHEYQVRAGWACAAHDEDSNVDPADWRTDAYMYPFALDVTLGVQGLAITFD